MSEASERNQIIINEFRENAGKVGGYFSNTELILLHTIGAKSGIEYVNPAAVLRDGECLVVFASKGGAPDNPGWYYNIVAHPEISVEFGTETFKVKAMVAEEPERTHLYDKMAAKNPNFEQYRKKTTREIPVIILNRVEN